MTTHIVVTLEPLEVTGLRDLVEQFTTLLTDARHGHDPAVDRLTPEVYPEDPEASREFRRLTSSDLIARRHADAAVLLASLPGDAEPSSVTETRLDADTAEAWMRTLAALRLVIADRLGIAEGEAGATSDDRFGIYDWLGYRLDALIDAMDAD